jgi:serine/threonine-protein kinase
MRAHSRAGTATWSGTGAQWCDTIPDAPLTQCALGTNPGASEQALAAPGRKALGPYRLLKELGQGGMARVYLAEHELLRRRVAIKTLLPQFAGFPLARDMFVREARIAGMIRHANLVPVYDFIDDPVEGPYYVMEYTPGETLAARLGRGRPPLSQCFDIAIHVSDALAAVHAAGYLHRDIKSENVLLTLDGRRIVPKLIDFGIAKPIASDGDEPMGIVGTPRTMSPEQIAQEPIDERADIWAMGVLMYEMLAGALPFPSGSTMRDDLVAIVTEAHQPLPEILAADLRAIVDACLAKEPSERPESAAVLAGRLRTARATYLEQHDLIERALVADEAWTVIAELEAELAA